MIRRIATWWSDQLYIHPPKRARQIGRWWLWAGLAMLALFVVGLVVRNSYAFLLGGGWVICVGEWWASNRWADGWEARDKRGQP